MKKELREKLYKKYPEIFEQKDLDMTKTAMCWGFDFNSGWYDIVDEMCEDIMHYCKSSNVDIPRATQAKEKYGTLNFYIAGGDRIIDKIINYAETQSEITCEVCGEYGKIDYDQMWLKCLCKKHHKEFYMTERKTHKSFGS